jgi:methionine-rich copper-binding protein CopC
MDGVPRSFAMLLTVFALVLVGRGSADAHASLVSTSPEDGSTIATAPPSVALTFSEDVESGDVAVAAPDGSKVTTSEPRLSGPTMTADLEPSDQRGQFTVSYRVVTGDGHPVTGQFTFTTTEGRHVTHEGGHEEAPTEESFVDRHGTLLVVGLALAVLAIGVMLAPLARGRRE